MKNYVILCTISVMGLFACEKSKTKLKPLDLLQYGVPITIMAPDSAKVKAGSLSFSQDITIKSETDNYDIQIFAYDATTTNLDAIKASHLADVKNGPFFSKVIEEEDVGFIYETNYDSTSTSYGFKYFRVQGDKEYIFQTGLVGSFKLEDVKRMYEAVKQKE